ncbi:MAG: monovalent cation/H(+) antiporter subunit G [Pseudomonadota bacterium]
MSAILDILGWGALCLGGFFCVVGALGLNRMPDVFTRMHATSVSDTMGVGLLVVGMLSQTTDWTVAVRLVIIVIVLYVTGAVASHALARAALHDGEKPLLAGPDGTLKKTDCGDVFPELAVRIATPLVSEQVDDSVDPEEMLDERIEEDDPSNS